MVRGRGIAVTAVALMYQWADTTRITRGRGTVCPNARHAAEYRLTSSAFIGLPCPKNADGITAGALLLTGMPTSPPQELSIALLCHGSPATWNRNRTAHSASP